MNFFRKTFTNKILNFIYSDWSRPTVSQPIKPTGVKVRRQCQVQKIQLFQVRNRIHPQTVKNDQNHQYHSLVGFQIVQKLRKLTKLLKNSPLILTNKHWWLKLGWSKGNGFESLKIWKCFVIFRNFQYLKIWDKFSRPEFCSKNFPFLIFF